jgi:hypothetical protein
LPLEINSVSIQYPYSILCCPVPPYVVVLILLALELDLDAEGLAPVLDPLFLNSGVASVFHILLLYPGKEA